MIYDILSGRHGRLRFRVIERRLVTPDDYRGSIARRNYRHLR